VNTWYLGIHMPNWLARPELAEVPVFISRRTFYDRRAGRYRRTFPRAAGRYAIDSGGFTELKDHGRWTITPAEYVDFLDRVWEETGAYDFAAPMDWMCEPAVISGGRFAGLHFVGTGLSEAEHQRLTLDNFLDLRTRAPRRRVAPVLQAWRRRGYLRHRAMYAAAGIDLSAEPVVGLGSVCRRQDTDEAADIIDSLLDSGVRNLHGFGFKIEGLRRCWAQLATADSLSWSKDGRHAGPCQHPPYSRGSQPISEANCLPYALAWRHRHVRPPTRHYERQLDLFADCEEAA
jgi:hypothetical protein